jgi:hypothetical protein
MVVTKDLKEIRTSLEGIKREYLDRLGGKKGMHRCWPQGAWCCNELLVVAVYMVTSHIVKIP